MNNGSLLVDQVQVLLIKSSFMCLNHKCKHFKTTVCQMNFSKLTLIGSRMLNLSHLDSNIFNQSQVEKIMTIYKTGKLQ